MRAGTPQPRMFWRLVRNAFRLRRRRLAVALLAMVVGSAVTSGLLNFYFDVVHKMRREFRAYGANLAITPSARQAIGDAPRLLDASVMDQLPAANGGATRLAAAPYLYVVARLKDESVVVAGTWFDALRPMASWWKVEGNWIDSRTDSARAMVGVNVARRFGLAPGQAVELRYGLEDAVRRTFYVAGVVETGGSEDNQVFLNLDALQEMTGLKAKLSAVLVSASGSTEELERYAEAVARVSPAISVKPIRQIAENEGRVVERVRWLIFSTTTVILIVSALCVLATMTAIAFERRKDVGVMKALGAEEGNIVRLFLAEAAMMGLVSGLAGYLIGLGLAQWMGHSIFHSSVMPRPVVFPIVVLLSLAVAMAGTIFPVRRVGRIEPAVILRGE